LQLKNLSTVRSPKAYGRQEKEQGTFTEVYIFKILVVGQSLILTPVLLTPAADHSELLQTTFFFNCSFSTPEGKFELKGYTGKN